MIIVTNIGKILVKTSLFSSIDWGLPRWMLGTNDIVSTLDRNCGGVLAYQSSIGTEATSLPEFFSVLGLGGCSCFC